VIISRAFYREAGKTTLAIAAVLLVVFLLLMMTTLLGRAVRGDHPEDIVLTLLMLQTVHKIDLLLPLALYLGVLLTLSRWYRDNEMTVLAACGVGLAQMLRLVMWFTLVFALVVAACAFYLTPYASRLIEKAKSEGAHRTEIQHVAPGAFTEASGGGRILYVEKIDDAGGDMENVFLAGLDAAKQDVVVARTGRPYIDEATGDKFMALKDGVLYQGAPGDADYQIVEFNILHVRMEPRKAVEPPIGLDGMPSADLFVRGDPQRAAEWHWRLAKPVAVFVLAAFALVLAYTDVRRGRFSNFVAAILVYFIYSNLIGMGETLIKRGYAPPALGIWWVHGGMTLAVAYLLWRRAHNRPLLALPRGFRRR